MLRTSHTTVIERNTTWRGVFEAEPYEVGWADEAVYFIRALAATGSLAGAQARIQISPDGIHWCDEGSVIDLPAEAGVVTFARVSHFGSWLRLVGQLPGDAELQILVYLVLKS